MVSASRLTSNKVALAASNSPLYSPPLSSIIECFGGRSCNNQRQPAAARPTPKRTSPCKCVSHGISGPKAIKFYCALRQAQNATQQLSPDDAALLGDTMDYFDALVFKVHQSLYKIGRKCLLYGIVNCSMWIMRQVELKDMEGEFYTGMQQFDVRRAPSELRAAIVPAAAGNAGEEAPASNPRKSPANHSNSLYG
ncbi:hypothetical protein N7467_002937 [Penicillium canescens]|nr:hypothetical protein N7467_002937 [Penicillium canescens]